MRDFGNDNLLHSELTWKIIKAFYTVYNTLGYGFLEKVYENALVIELRKMGLFVSQQEPCLLYTSDAADERSSVDLGGRRIIKKKNYQ